MSTIVDLCRDLEGGTRGAMIETIENVLKLAREGKVGTLAIVAESADNTTISVSYLAGSEDFGALIGALRIAEHNLLKLRDDAIEKSA